MRRLVPVLVALALVAGACSLGDDDASSDDGDFGDPGDCIVVDLSVSKGRKPLTVSDWTGKDADEATTALERTGFDVTSTDVSELQRLLGPQNAPLKVHAAMARTGDAGGRDR